MIKLTDNETAVLKAIDDSEYGDYLSDAIWTWSVWDNIDSSIVPNRESLSGIISSLTKKGLVYSTDEGEDSCIELSEAGIQAYIEKVGADKINKAI